MKRKLIASLICSVLWSPFTSAATGHFLNVTTVGSKLTLSTVANPYNPNFVYESAGISNAPSSGFSYGCTRQPNGYCPFRVGAALPQEFTITGPSGPFSANVCLNAMGDTANCEDISVTGNRFVYITGNADAGEVSVCPMNPVTGVVDVVHCENNTNLPVANSSTFGIALNPAGTWAFLTDNSGGVTSDVYRCIVNPTTGLLAGCEVNNDFAFTSPYGITLNSTGTYAYIADRTGGVGNVIRCSVNPATGDFTVCARQEEFTTAQPYFLALSPNGGYLYVADEGASTVTKCTVSPTDGTLSSCDTTGQQAGWNQPSGIVISPSGNIAYVNDYASGNIYYCQVSSATGALSGCSQSACGGANLYGIAMNSAGTKVYSLGQVRGTAEKRLITGTVEANGSLSCEYSTSPYIGVAIALR